MDSFTARQPVDLLAVVPFVIGFHPEDSVVLLTFAGPRPGFHARVDLPLVEEDQRRVVAMLHDVVTRNRAGSVALVLYTDDSAAAVLFAELMVPPLVDGGVHVVDVLRVDGDRYFSLADPDDPGTPYDLSSHAFTATQVVRGRVVHDSRAALADSLVGTDEDDAGAVADAATDVVSELLAAGASGRPLGPTFREHARWLDRWIADHVATPATERQPLPAAVAGRLLVLVSFDALKEVAWSPMTRATARDHAELWRGLVRRAPSDLRAGAAGLLGFAAWLDGDGALAWCAVDRCSETDPDDDLAQHVASLVESATPPAVWSPVPVEQLRIFGPGPVDAAG